MTHWPFIIRDCVLIKPGKYKTFTSLSSLAETLVKEGVVPYKIKRNPIFLKIIANQIVLSLMQDAQIGEIFFQKDNQSKEMSMHNLRCGFVPKDGQTEEMSTLFVLNFAILSKPYFARLYFRDFDDRK
jgi:hypothetical protein